MDHPSLTQTSWTASTTHTQNSAHLPDQSHHRPILLLYRGVSDDELENRRQSRDTENLANPSLANPGSVS